MTGIGATWWKFDFHTHTPASGDYGRGFVNPADITPRAWLEKFIENDIQCVVVTDHNTTKWLNDLKTEAQALKEQGKDIHIFPGIEITANGNIHILGIFDPSCSDEHVAGLIGAVKGTSGQIEKPCEYSATQVVDEIHRLGGLAIPAHIDIAAGAFGIGSWQTYKELMDKVDAVEVVFPEKYDEWDSNRKQKFDYLSNKPKVIGSDAHMPREVGRAFTWIKMGQPDINGLKLALIDGVSSVKLGQECSGNPNLIKSNKIIHSIKVKNFKYINRRDGLEVNFSPWLNSIIGSRGAGKSSLIEYSRIVLGKEEQLERNKTLIPEIFKSFQQFKKVSKDRDDIGVIEENALLSCIYEKDNTKYKINWGFGDVTQIFKMDNQGNEVLEHGNVSKRFPVSIYSQKQIFEMSKNPYFLVGVIDIEKQISHHYDEMKNRTSALATDFIQLKQLNLKISRQQDIEGRLSEISNILAQIENEQNREVIEKFKKYNKKNIEVNLFFDHTSELVGGINEVCNKCNFSNLDEILDEGEYPDRAILLREKIHSLKESLTQHISDIETLSSLLKEDLTKGKFQENLTNSDQCYRETMSVLEQSGVNFDEHSNLLQEQAELQNAMREIEDFKTQKEDLDKKIIEIYEEIVAIRMKISTLRQEFIDTHFGQLTNVKVKLMPFGIINENSFREVIDKKENVFVSSIYDPKEEKGILFDLLKEILKQESLDQAVSLIHEFKKSLLSDTLGEKILDTCEKRLVEHLYNMQKTDHFSLDLLSWFPEDDLIIEFKTNNGSFQSIHKGSAGQKSATILSLLLSFGDEPLILDQPEDDLDNSLITELIVEKVKERKNLRQIIIVTHNPNIVVNGDSENIIALDNRGVIKVVSNGALQTKEVRTHVCKIMEGGIKALEKRYSRMIGLGL